MAFSFLQQNDGSWRDTLLTAHFERAILRTVRHDEPLPRSQQRRAAMITRAPLQLLLACLEGKIRLLPFATVINVGCKSFLSVLIKNGAHYALYYISQRGFFSLHFYFLLRKRELLAGHGRLSFVLYIYFSLKKRVDTHINVGV